MEDYVLKMFCCVVPVEEDTCPETEMPTIADGYSWVGLAALVSQDEYQQFFPNEQQTPSEYAELIKHILLDLPMVFPTEETQQ